MSESKNANSSKARDFRKEQRIKRDPRMFMVSPEFWKKIESKDKPVEAEYPDSIEDR